MVSRHFVSFAAGRKPAGPMGHSLRPRGPPHFRNGLARRENLAAGMDVGPARRDLPEIGDDRACGARARAAESIPYAFPTPDIPHPARAGSAQVDSRPLFRDPFSATLFRDDPFSATRPLFRDPCRIPRHRVIKPGCSQRSSASGRDSATRPATGPTQACCQPCSVGVLAHRGSALHRGKWWASTHTLHG